MLRNLLEKLGVRTATLVASLAKSVIRRRGFDYARGWHPRKKGPGIFPTRGHRERTLLTTAERHAKYKEDSVGQRPVDAPKRASRTMPSSWIGTW